MSSPYRHAVAALRERREQIARELGETDDELAKLSTERMRLRIELDALEARLATVRRAPFDASPVGPARARSSMLTAAVGPLVAFGVATACPSWPQTGRIPRIAPTPPFASGSGVYVVGPMPDALLLEGDPADRR